MQLCLPSLLWYLLCLHSLGPEFPCLFYKTFCMPFILTLEKKIELNNRRKRGKMRWTVDQMWWFYRKVLGNLELNQNKRDVICVWWAGSDWKVLLVVFYLYSDLRLGWVCEPKSILFLSFWEGLVKKLQAMPKVNHLSWAKIFNERVAKIFAMKDSNNSLVL